MGALDDASSVSSLHDINRSETLQTIINSHSGSIALEPSRPGQPATQPRASRSSAAGRRGSCSPRKFAQASDRCARHARPAAFRAHVPGLTRSFRRPVQCPWRVERPVSPNSRTREGRVPRRVFGQRWRTRRSAKWRSRTTRRVARSCLTALRRNWASLHSFAPRGARKRPRRLPRGL
jgi:hypothetical protein